MWTPPEGRRVRCTPGFLLLAALLVYLCDDLALLWCALGSAAVHELGHVAAALALGGRPERLTLSLAGAELSFSYRRPLSYGRESLVALAGPCANLILGVPAMRLGQYLPAALCLGLGGFNLLPVLPLDGGVILYDLIAARFGPERSELALAISAGMVIGVLLGLGAAALACYANATLLLTALWLLAGAVRPSAGEGLRKTR